MLDDVAAPDEVEVAIGIREDGQRSGVRDKRAAQLPASQARFDDRHVLRSEVQRDNLAARTDELSHQGQEAPDAAGAVQHPPARLNADRSEHRLVLWAAGIEVGVKPLNSGEYLASGGRVGTRGSGRAIGHAVPSTPARR